MNKRLAMSGVLLDRLVHDLKQPINGLCVVAQDVRIDATKGRLDVATVPESMRDIESAAHEIASRLDRLRCFVRAPTHQQMTAVDVTGACHAALERSRHVTAINESLTPQLTVQGISSADLEQAISELVDNALQATTDARVDVSTIKRGDDVVVGVRDNGHGIAQNVQPKIFESFFSTRESAAGLGLPLARALVSTTGRVELVETGPQGSLFEIVLSSQEG